MVLPIEFQIPIALGFGAVLLVLMAEKLHEKIPGSRLSVFEGVGHMLNLEAPERFNRELKVFLEDAGGTR